MFELRDPASIPIGNRHRRELGDLKSLADSIDRVGLLHPIVVTRQGELVAGERRLRAWRMTKSSEPIPAHVVDLPSIVAGEFAENIVRKDFTLSEAVAIKRALEPELRAQAEQRMRAGRPSVNLAEGSDSRDKVATFTGLGRTTLDKAEDVVAAAEDPSHRATTPYPQISIADICALPVASLFHFDAVLWPWTTNHHLLAGEACAVLTAWGFEPKTMLSWAKPQFGCGERLRGQTEHCILAVRGSPVLTLTNQSTLLVAPSGVHSEKPDAFYELVQSLCPAPQYLELFARRTRPGWVGWGDQAPTLAAAE